MCDLCKDAAKEEYAFVSLRVGQRTVTAGACEQCFKAAVNKQPAFKAMLAAFLPVEWKGVIFGGSEEKPGLSVLRF